MAENNAEYLIKTTNHTDLLHRKTLNLQSSGLHSLIPQDDID